MPLPKVGETISAEDFASLGGSATTLHVPAVGETISASDFEKLGAIPPKTGVGGLRGLGVGAAKGMGSTIVGGEKLLAGATRKIGSLIGSKNLQGTQADSILEPYVQAEGLAEKIGFVAEQVGEFLLPVPGGAKAKLFLKATEKFPQALKAAEKAAQFVKGAGKLAGRVGLESSEAAGRTALQTGGDSKDVGIAAIAAGAIPIVSSALRPLFKSAGLRIEQALVKPTARDIKDGFKAENIFKYKLGGTLEGTAEKTHTNITQRVEALKQALGTTKKTLNLNAILDQAKKEAARGQAKTFGFNTRMNSAFDFLKGEISVVAKNGKADLATSQEIKRSTGKLGAWQFGQRDPDANALESAANAFYTKLKEAIEKASPGNVKQINKELSELIPIEHALIRRLPIAERNNLLSLGDITSALPAFASASNIWLFALNRFLKSGLTAEGLYGISQTPGNLLKAGVLGSIPQITQPSQESQAIPQNR